MRKLLLTMLLLACWATGASAQYVGAYGQFYIPEDTVRFQVTVHDTTGLVSAAWDSCNILRYYRGVRIDSLDETSATSLRTGLYEIKLKADKESTYSITDEDSIGQYYVVVQVFKQTKNNQKAFTYTVLRGYGLHGLYNLEMFLGTPDNCFRILFPVGGIAPKDSVQYKRIDDKNGNGSIEGGDTTFVCTVYFYHGTNPGVLDSSKVIMHRNDL
jgi:hypothetical protein